MTNTIKFAFSLHKPVFEAFEFASEDEESNGRALMRDVLTRYAVDHLGLSPSAVPFDLELYRSLTQEVADAAVEIIESDGWQEDITLKAVQRCQSRSEWLESYRQLINDGEFVTGNKVKSSVNQNFGHYVKHRLNARNKLDENGNRATVQVAGELLRSFTLLLPNE